MTALARLVCVGWLGAAAAFWAGPAPAAQPQGTLHLTLRKRVETAPGSGSFQAVQQQVAWEAGKTAVIVCDMWARHWCAGARRRGEEMAPRMNQLLQEARKRGVLVIHAPSGAMDLYKDHPARKRAQAAPKAANLPKGIANWCTQIEAEKKGKYPVDQSDGGCDDQPCCDVKSKMDLHQTPALEIRDEDALSDSGVEIWNLMEQRGIANVMLLGVHTNMCVLGRPFGLRNMAQFGKNVVLVRDLTDTMYNPRAWPHVSHFRGTELIVEHIEKYVCPTITSDQIFGGTPLRFSGDRFPPKLELWIGAATADITPKPPVALTGFQTVRITRTIQSPLTANVLALESRQGDRVLDQAILISCDLCILRPGIQEGFRKHAAARLPGFNMSKLFLAATHTHSAPVLVQSQYDEKDYGDAMQPKDYVPLLYDRMAEAAAKAWESRAVGGVARGLGHAVVGHNRRVVYADGHAQMLGNTSDPQFRHMEGYEDHAVDILCFYDAKRQMKAAVVALACTAQMSQGDTVVSADFWHDARERMRRRYGKELCVLGLCAPAGDQCPHLSYRKRSEARMDRLRGLTRTQELGRRIANAFLDVADVIAGDVRDELPLVHVVRQIDLPTRIVTDAEHATARKVCADIDAKKERGPWDAWVRQLYGGVCQRYLDQKRGKRVYSMELHVLRLGDVAIATNPFELYLDYGVQIEARSAAEQTILVQLAAAGSESGHYVPTPRAVAGGGLTESPMNNYSATVMADVIGPDGAQVLVQRTVETIHELWKAPAK